VGDHIVHQPVPAPTKAEAQDAPGLGSAAGCLVRPLVGLAADRGIGGSMATVALMLGVGCLGLLAMAWGSPVLRWRERIRPRRR
jgi:nitrate/nitrite transporter NarK